MGRTLPTIINTLQAEADAWKLFRRALRKEDQEAFDALWRYARRHAAPAAMASRPLPIEAVLMSMLVGLQRQVMELENRLLAWRRETGHDGPERMDL
jgi:hypothetical protein